MTFIRPFCFFDISLSRYVSLLITIGISIIDKIADFNLFVFYINLYTMQLKSVTRHLCVIPQFFLLYSQCEKVYEKPYPGEAGERKKAIMSSAIKSAILQSPLCADDDIMKRPAGAGQDS